MTIRARIGAHAKWAGTSDRAAATAPARSAAATALDQRLIAEYGLDPDRADFAQRIAHARRAHFSRLALRSAKARRKPVARAA